MNKKVKSIKTLIILFVMLMTLTLIVTPALAYTHPILNESFEQGISGTQNDGWVYANVARWGTSAGPSKDGTHSLDQPNGDSNGLIYDTTIFNPGYTLSGGSIEGWILSGTNYKIPAFWLRSGTQTTGGASCTTGTTSSICTGYLLRFYVDNAYLTKMTPTGPVDLASYNLGGTGYNIGAWWHLKLEAVGTTISAWVTTSSTFTLNPQMSVTDGSYGSGYAGLSSRSNFICCSYDNFFDSVKITDIVPTVETFDQGISGSQNDGWSYANIGRWGTTSSNVLEDLNNVGSSGLIYDTVQFTGYSMTDGSIDGWVYSQNTNYKTTAFWLRSGTQTTGGASCTTGATTSSICTGYIIRLYVNHAYLTKMTPTGPVDLASYDLGTYIIYTWFHLKLSTVGTTINAWISNSSTFTPNPQMSITDGSYSSGYAALSSRTNFITCTCPGNFYNYFDTITII